MQGLKSRGIEPLPLDLPGHGARGDMPAEDVTLSDTLAIIDEETEHLPRFDLVEIGRAHV